MSRLIIVVLILFGATPVWAHGPPPEEIEELTEHLRESPEDAEAYLERAKLHKILEHYHKALEDLQRASEYADSEKLRVEIAELRGEVAKALGRDAEAVEQFTEAIERGGGSVERHAGRAAVHERNDRIEEAIADYRAALEYADNVDVYLDLGQLQAGTDRLDAAATTLERGLEATGSVVLREELIEIERERGHYGRALKLIEGGMEEAEVETRWHLRRGDILEEVGREDRARAARERALEEAERLLEIRKSAAAYAARGEARLRLGRVEAAIADLEKAVNRAAHLDRARELLSEAREKTEGGE